MLFRRIFCAHRRERVESDFFDVFHGETLLALHVRFGLSRRGTDASDKVVATGERVRELYLITPELQWRYPLGLLPVGQKRFVKWLFGKGRAQHNVSNADIFRFLHQTASDLRRGIIETYLVNPKWQERFPYALLPDGQRRFLRWLCGQFPRFRSLRQINNLCSDAFSPKCYRKAKVFGVNILAHFCYPSGLQQAALAVKAALESADCSTSCRDVPAGVATDLAPRADWLGLEAHPITVINVAPVPHFANCYLRAGLHRREGVYRIANWYWELETAPAEWSDFAGLIDEIWAPTPFVGAAMRATMHVPVYDILPGVSLGKSEEISRGTLGIPDNHFLFLFMFDMCSEIERKNPIGLIHAFRRAFAPNDRASLLIKSSRGNADPTGLRMLKDVARENAVLLFDELTSRERALGYTGMCDCFVSLHRAEGFGLGLAEAMLLGKPVIATNYSGNLAFMNQDNSFLVDYKIIEIEKSGPIYKKGFCWANPSEDHAAAQMREVFDNRDEAAKRAERGQLEVMQKLSIERAGCRMKERLSQICREHAIPGCARVPSV